MGKMLKDLLKLPNIITSTKFVLLPVMVYYAAVKNYTLFLVLYIVNWVGDILDGYLARRLNMQTKLGYMLDTLTDTLFIIATYISLYLFWREFILDNLVFPILFVIIHIITNIIWKTRFNKILNLHLWSARGACLIFTVFAIVSMNAKTPSGWLFNFSAMALVISAFEELYISIRIRNLNEEQIHSFLDINK
ncbi:MAG: CDP-alcohol phosphatidyltransferase family protein [archaeon]